MSDLTEAIALIEAEKFDEAREIIVDILYQNYDNLEAWLLLTHCALDRQEYARAVREALRIDPDNVAARRMAVELAREVTRLSPEYPEKVKRRKASPLRVFVNWLMVLLVAGGATSIVYLLFLNDAENDPVSQTVATTDPLQVCVQHIDSTLNRLPARCGFVETGQLCLANLPVEFEMQDEVLRPNLVGDRTEIGNIRVLNTASFDLSRQTWGLVALRGQTSLTGNDGVLFVVTHGVRFSHFDEQMQTFTFSSNPVVSPCQTLPPSGILAESSIDKSAIFSVNAATIELSGTAFFQVDVAAGLRIVVLAGQAAILENAQILREIKAGQWLSWSVDPTLLVKDLPSGVMVGTSPVRGALEELSSLGDAFAMNVDQWTFPSASIASEVSPTPTVYITLTPLVTPTLRSQTLTRTPTPLPPDFVSPTSTIVTNSDVVLEGIWRCSIIVNHLPFRYIITFEPFESNQFMASGLLPNFADSIVGLVGERVTDETLLDEPWSQLSETDSASEWIILRETTMIYDASSGGYAAGGIFRLILTDEGIMTGGVFTEDDELIGFVNRCEQN